MAWSAYIKVSLEGDEGLRLRRLLTKELDAAGFDEVEKLTWFVDGGDRLDIQEALGRVLLVLADPRPFVKTDPLLNSLEIRIERT